MGLADTAKKAREEAENAGYRFLKELRRMGDTYSEKAVGKKWGEIAEFDRRPESLTLEGQAKLFRMIAEANEADEIGKLCRKIVAAAERVERQKKGEAAKIDIAKVAHEIAGIRARWKKNLQMGLDELEGGGADECFDEGDEPDPAGAFRVGTAEQGAATGK